METPELTSILREVNLRTLFQIGLIALTTVVGLLLLQRAISWVAGKLSGRYRLYTLASIPLLRLAIILLAVLLIIPRLIEPTFENLVALAGAAGLALGFALKDYASSLLAGIIALYEMPYRPGDWVEIDGAYGEVKSIGMRALELVTPDDTVVVVPHLKLWDRLIFNANDGTQNLLCVAHFYLDPNHDAAQVKKTLRDVALTSAFLQVRQPVNLIVAEKPWGTEYRIKAYPIDPRNQFHFITDLTVRGKAALTGLGVDFARAPQAVA